MKEMQVTEMILLTITALALLAFPVKDMVLTARRCLFCLPSNFVPTWRQTSGDRLTVFIVSVLRSFQRSEFLLKRLDLIVPLLQIIIWKLLLVGGFAVLYLANGWQSQNETPTDDNLDDFAACLRLSLIVSFRFAHYELTLDNPVIFWLANIQFYAGFLFFGFICFYLITLRQKARQLKPRLYKLRYEMDEFCYSPFALADSLREYSRFNLLIILKDWEQWAEELKINLRLHRQFIYGGIPFERNVGWLAALSVVLDACAALIVTSEGAVEKQARRTFGAARRALVETAELIVPNTPENQETHKTTRFQTDDFAETDEVLSAPLIFEETPFSSGRDEMLGIWRFTYEKNLRSLSAELEADIPLIKNDGLRR